MKWLKSRQQFLNEAKLREVIFPRQAKEVAKVWGEKFLDYEEVVPTDNIIQGKWKLDKEDKDAALSAYFDADLVRIYNDINSLPDRFCSVLSESIKLDLLTSEKFKIVMKDFNMKSPSIDQLVCIFDNVFRKLSISETQATEMIQKDENGRPVRDEDGNMLRIQKEAGDPIFSNNLVNIKSFIEDYNRCFRDEQVNINIFDTRDIRQMRNLALTDENREYNLIDFDIFNKDVYLQIQHNPKDILNMSISKFYASCQHLYGGGYRKQLLSNVFDPNSIPAFLIFDTPIFWENEKINDFLPLSRMMIRNIETLSTSEDKPAEKKIFFDRAYPDRMKDVFGKIIEKYSKNVETVDLSEENPTYVFTPDVEIADTDVIDPYMDRLGLKRKPMIGKNTKTLYLNRNYDWTNIKVNKEAKIKEVVIETPQVPNDLLAFQFNPDWVKFKYIRISTLEPFRNLLTKSIAFDKCKFDGSMIDTLQDAKGQLEKLQFISCDINNNISFKQFRRLKELHLIFSLDSIDQILRGLPSGLEKLIISTDLIQTPQDKEKLTKLKESGLKIETIGPKI
jgi:hypothetical protein